MVIWQQHYVCVFLFHPFFFFFFFCYSICSLCVCVCVCSELGFAARKGRAKEGNTKCRIDGRKEDGCVKGILPPPKLIKGSAQVIVFVTCRPII